MPSDIDAHLAQDNVARIAGGFFLAFILASVLASTLGHIGLSDAETLYQTITSDVWLFRLGLVFALASALLFLMAAWALYVLCGQPTSIWRNCDVAFDSAVGGSGENGSMKIVLVPPLLCSTLAYAPVIDTVWSHGQVSLADTRHDDTIAAMAERILRENAGEFAILGTSMGGYVALEVVRQAPDRVTALALVSTSARADTTEQVKARSSQSALVEDGHFDALVDAAFPGVVAADNEADQALLATWRAMTSPVGPGAFLRQQRAVVQRADLRSMLPSITCPTVIIHGAADRLIPLADAAETATAMPAATFAVIAGAGHFLFHERPAAARDAVDTWLESAE